MNTELIGSNIKRMREERELSQQALADAIPITRPVISHWENGKTEPSSTQLRKIAEIFEVSADEILGMDSGKQLVVVVDTSALIKRPNFISELLEKFDQVIVPDIVIAELNGLKDNKKKRALNQVAWLAMMNLNNSSKHITHLQSKKTDGTNDEKIADIAIRQAKAHPNSRVYMLSDDIYFKFLVKDISNLLPLTPKEYAEEFSDLDQKHDLMATMDFIAAIKTKDIKKLKSMDLSQVDVNYRSSDDGQAPLISAVRSGDPEIVEFLLSCPEVDINIQDKQKYCFSAIHHATQMKRLDLIKILANHGADIDIASSGKNSGNTPLMIAAWSGLKAGVEFYLENGSRTNQQDDNGFTALTKACIKNKTDIIKLLLDVTDISIRCRKNKSAIDYLNPKNADAVVIDLLNKVNK